MTASNAKCEEALRAKEEQESRNATLCAQLNDLTDKLEASRRRREHEEGVLQRALAAQNKLMTERQNMLVVPSHYFFIV